MAKLCVCDKDAVVLRKLWLIQFGWANFGSCHFHVGYLSSKKMWRITKYAIDRYLPSDVRFGFPFKTVIGYNAINAKSFGYRFKFLCSGLVYPKTLLFLVLTNPFLFFSSQVWCDALGCKRCKPMVQASSQWLCNCQVQGCVVQSTCA